METTKRFSASELKSAAQLLARGKLVAFPTETVYGLGANALDKQAVKDIFTAKGRPADNPLIVHIAKQADIKPLAAEVPVRAQKLIDEFWPGPLSVVVPKSSQVPEITTGGLDTIAVRRPDHPLALELIKLAQVPLAAPSANLSGRPSPTLAQHVIEDLAGRISGVVDGGPTGIGVESTVVDCSQSPPVLLRPGNITYQELKAVLGEIKVDQGVSVPESNPAKVKPSAPGMKYKHYSPQAKVVVVEGPVEAIAAKINSLADKQSDKVGIMSSTENINQYKTQLTADMGSRKNLREISANLFKLLREFDEKGVEVIMVEGVAETGVGLAVMNRLRKAAEERILVE